MCESGVSDWRQSVSWVYVEYKKKNCVNSYVLQIRYFCQYYSSHYNIKIEDNLIWRRGNVWQCAI